MDPNWTHITRMKKFVNIRKRKDRGTYRLIWHNAEGKEVTKTYQSKKQALAGKIEKEREIAENGLNGASYNSISDEDKRTLCNAKKFADEQGFDIWDAVRGHSKYLKNMKVSPLMMKQGVEQCLVDKKNEGCDSRTLQTMRSPLRRFARSCPRRQVNDVTHHDITDWVNELNVSTRTRVGYLTELRTFFSWAVQKGFSENNPVIPALPSKKAKKKIMNTKREVRASQVLTPKEAGIIMDYCEREYPLFTRYAALCLFGGLRPEKEGKLIPWTAVKTTNITVDWRIAKDNETRIIEPLTPNLIKWIKLTQDRESKEWTKSNGPYRNHKKVWDRVKKQIGRPWPHDAMRHSYASYHFAMFKDAGLTAKNLGHPDTNLLRKDYNSAVTEEAAKKFWAI
jgi:integrase